MFIKRLFLLLTVAYNFHKTTAVHYGEIEIECENDTCTKCYKTLATELLKNADNYIALQSTFFPPDDSGPDFVIVTYVFDNRNSSVNETTESDEIGSASQNLELNGDIWFDEQYYNNVDMNKVSQNLSNHIWFWSSSAYFFYHPLRVIQFTSLGFSDPYLKQRSISLRLPTSCYYSEGNGDRGPFNMKLLTQRLQLFAMHQKITGQIDSTYTAQSHSLESLRDWHVQNPHVSILILSSQCIFPFFASIFLVLYFLYLIELDPINLGKKLNSQAADESPGEIKHAAISTVWIIVTISILFTVGVITADIGALVEYTQLPEEIKSYFNDHSNSASFQLYLVPIIMLFFDFLSLVLFIFGPYIVVSCFKCYKCIQKCCRDSHCCAFSGISDQESKPEPEPESKHVTSSKWKRIQKCCKCSCFWCECEFKVSNSLYTLLSPLSCIGIHSYHIIFAFINNPYHATSVLLLYIMTLFVLVVIFQKIYYFVHNRFEEKQKIDNVDTRLPSSATPPGTPQSTPKVPQPTPGAPQPAPEAPQPAAGVSQPAPEAPQPAAGASQPAPEASQPAPEAPQPAAGASQPAPEAPQPAAGASQPAHGAPQPTPGSRNLCGCFRRCSSEAPQPTPRVPQPAPEAPQSAPEILQLTPDSEATPRTSSSGQRGKHHKKRCAIATSFILVIIALATCIGLTVAVLIALPINNAIDLASTEIYAIYQASVTVFAALIAFQVFFRRKNSIFTVFIKAADNRGLEKSNSDQEKWKKWKKMSEKEKEIYLGDIILSHIHFEAPVPVESSVSASPTPTTSSPTIPRVYTQPPTQPPDSTAVNLPDGNAGSIQDPLDT